MNGQNARIAAAARERGEAVPTSIADVPVVWTTCQPYFEAFNALAPRMHVQILQGAAKATVRYERLPYTEWSQYARDHELVWCPDDMRDFLYLVAQMEDEYLLMVNTR